MLGDPVVGGACFIPLSSCAGETSSGGVHLGYFRIVLDALGTSMLEASLPSTLIFHPATVAYLSFLM